ncbi:S66 peptidase family protein [Faecalibacter rhinopitheci]|uniref:LD-carboxypeptidase n=1 Tax=Faecalibacter rhinopitheci TaxID=2779678 RepID=A0A8J7FNC7_9FLAO|nr:LD-carboxypeptidase [Faecalibacter rhinopitheci]MBF0597622.1 LD-carboxypeptidase [Faecalibacter rhinopitheci]
MIRPAYLQKGDKIAIVAPAKRMIEGELEEAINLIQEWGFEVTLGKNIYKEYNLGYLYAGTDEERAEDFQWALDDPSIKAIWCARGGYGCVKIIDKLDFSTFKQNPKWIIGYSDITVFHNHINQLGFQTIHGVTAKKLVGVDYHENSYLSLYKTLVGEKINYTIPTTHLFNKVGEAEGELVGGNLSIIYSLLGSISAINPKGKILFIEDWFENWYAVDRMLMNLKRNGIFDQINGLILGSFTHMDTEEENSQNYYHPYDPNTYNVIQELTKTLNIPIGYEFPAGHTGYNLSLKMGDKVHLKVDANSVNLYSI